MKARSALAGVVAAALLGTGAAYLGPGTTGAPEDRSTRAASAAEEAFCSASLDRLGPITSCARVPLWGEVTEDDPWGRWDCRLDGNHLCGTTVPFVSR